MTFGTVEICRLAGVTGRQLEYWDQREILSPSGSSPRGSSARASNGLAYTIADVVAARGLAEMAPMSLRPPDGWTKTLRQVVSCLRRATAAWETNRDYAVVIHGQKVGLLLLDDDGCRSLAKFDGVVTVLRLSDFANRLRPSGESSRDLARTGR